MKPRTLVLFCAMTLFVVLTIAIQTFAQKTQDQIIIFDAGSGGYSENFVAESMTDMSIRKRAVMPQPAWQHCHLHMVCQL